MASTSRIRTLNFLPDIFQTSPNSEFLSATLDQVVNPPNTQKIQGYIGSKFGYGINAEDYYVVEPTKTRTDYQLEPGVVFTKTNENVAQDFITYPGIIDTLSIQGGITNNNSRLFNSQFYSWDSFTNLDKIINFNQYYWLPNGPPSVTVAAATVYSSVDYIVTDLANTYNIKASTSSSGTSNPTLSLLRGGTYSFIVNQDTQFWIQGQPGISGYNPSQPNQYTRNVFGVSNNGATNGAVSFTVPNKDAEAQYVFTVNNTIDVVSTIPFENINGQLLSTVGNIDGITSLNGLRVMFYNTGLSDEIGYVSSFFGETNFDTNNDALITPVTLTIGSSTTSKFILASGTTSSLTVNSAITFSTPVFGGVAGGQVYYIKSIVDSTSFTISSTINGSALTLTAGTGTMIANTNQGLYEEGYYTEVNSNFYVINYIGDPSNPTLRLIPYATIPTNQNIIPQFGNEWINLSFYRNTLGVISLVPYISAPLDTLYYQDGTNPDKVGIIKIIDSNFNNTLDVSSEIIGAKTFTSTNGIVFSNGLKVTFDGDVIPTSYLSGEYYVEGVGSAIQLIPVSSLECPEGFTEATYNPYSETTFSVGSYDATLFVPIEKDYITISRNSINRNAWSRSNRWFHIDIINATANYNSDSSIISTYATISNKASRPIIEFYPNLTLFNSGTIGKDAVDFIDFKTTDALTLVSDQKGYYPDIQVYTGYVSTITPVTSSTSTTITIPTSSINGNFTVGMYITDSTNILPTNTKIVGISTASTNTILSVAWITSSTLLGTSSASIVGSITTVNNYSLFPGSRVIFAADTNVNIRNQIYVANFSMIDLGTTPVITLTISDDSPCLPSEQVSVLRGYNYQGKSFYFDGTNWNAAQQKSEVNQAPYFDVFDSNGISFSDTSVYTSTSFTGCTLFAYGIGSGTDDPILGFPIRYSSIDNVGDISFDVTLNSQTFNYVNGSTPITQNVNTGYVHNYTYSGLEYRQIGWETAVATSKQYQVFNFTYDPTISTSLIFTCDIAAAPLSETIWPNIQVYINNVYQSASAYSYLITDTTTTITISTPISNKTVIQILLLSDQVSNTAYYQVPNNLNNNPFNTDLITANIGDIRTHYQSIYYNSPGFNGEVFGINNYRDLGDLVPYGTTIIQNSGSLVLPGAFFRSKNHDLFNSILYNSRQYTTYKQLLIYTVQNLDLVQQFSPAEILNSALDIITSSKSSDQSFFWSDMLPAQAPFKTSTYTFNNSLSTSLYPLTQVYNFDTANYNGILVYLTSIINGTKVTTQLINKQDYIISATAPSLEIILALSAGDIITIQEYNQTYGSFVPNTPTKLGMYPATIPTVILDDTYIVPTYFIVGHDGSYNKLFGDYDESLGLIDFRDQALLEFEKRIYNNLKLSNTIPIKKSDILPGFFRTTDYSLSEFLTIYTKNFLNWVGQNRLDYQTQLYNTGNPYTFNYSNSTDKLSGQQIKQGYWRGVYEYMFDTTTPNTTPWEMLGFTNQPDWWTSHYGPAPYTSDNLVLWNDIANGYIWNNGNPYTNTQLARPGLLTLLPVDSSGNLIDPFAAIVGNYSQNSFQRDWKVGDVGPVEYSYRKSSTYPFDLMRIYALVKPAEFFNLCVDLDNYKYNSEFNQFLVNDRAHLNINNIEIYGSGTAKTSYINWIVDYEKQLGLDATTNIKTMFSNLDVRLIYRLAGYSDNTLLQFYVEKSSPNTTTSSLLIPNESYSVLLYDNQPFNKITYSSVIVQQEADGSFQVYGNAQDFAYFTTLVPNYNGNYTTISIGSTSVTVANDYTSNENMIPYGTSFYSLQDVSQFICSYGQWLTNKGMTFTDMVNGVTLSWQQMVAEFLNWTQTGWQAGSIITLNPAATLLTINQPNSIVQPLTIAQSNFLLNQNLYPVNLKDMIVQRNDTSFTVKTLNQGDSFSYGQFNLGNFEHGIVFDNVTTFDDTIYNLTTSLKQNRLFVRGTKTADWNGTVNAYGFILNQDNIQEWSSSVKYTKGSIVTYKNKYWMSLTINEPSMTFVEKNWKQTNYNDIQKGLLPNASTRAYESSLFYDTNQSNLDQDSNLLGYSLIGYRPRDYLASADLTDIAQINIYKNFIGEKGTLAAVNLMKGITLPQGTIDYDVYENWAIKQSEYGGVLNNNFVDFRINESNLTSNPSIVSLTTGTPTIGSSQEISLSNLFNYGRMVSDPNVLDTIDVTTTNNLYPTAGYVNFDDVTMSSYFYAGLPKAVDSIGNIVSIDNFYVRNYMWLASYLSNWNVFSLKPIGQVLQVRNNLNGTATITFNIAHGLSSLNPVAIINFSALVDGYYIVTSVINNTEVAINLTTLNSNQTLLTGTGIGLSFETQRVSTPSKINTLDLNEADFITNTVWVDENTDGNWAVYRKTINYSPLSELTSSTASTLGSAVAYTIPMGYLVGDAGAGKVYRYSYNYTSTEFDLFETKTGGSSFGSVIAYSNNVYLISEPTSSSPKVYIYTLNDSVLSDLIVTYQSPITAPVGVTNWGSSLSISDDTNWIYISDIANNNVYVYRKDQILLTAGYFNVGNTYTITSVGTTDFTLIGAIQNTIGTTFIATGVGSGTGTAMQITYRQSTIISGLTTAGLSSGNNFGSSIASDHHGQIVSIGAPEKPYNSAIINWGSAYVYQRTTQNIEIQYNNAPAQPQILQLAWTPLSATTITSTSTSATGNYINCSISMAGFAINTPVIFTGSNFGTSNVSPNLVYYIASVSGNNISIKSSRSTSTAITLQTQTGLSFSVYVQINPIYVFVNGKLVQDNNYATIGSYLYYVSQLNAGDIVHVSDNQFNLAQTFTSNYNNRIGTQFGYSMDMNHTGSEILIGSPYEVDSNNIEGAVYRFTNFGANYGVVIGTNNCQLYGTRYLLINGYLVILNAGNAISVAQQINATQIPNIMAAATANNTIIIQLINSTLAQPKQELMIAAYDGTTLNELGIKLYNNTQIIKCPRTTGATRFGSTIKLNELSSSVIISAPVGTRYALTTFDYNDNIDIDNDTVFDNNATRFLESSPNAGAVYMFDYMSNYKENMSNVGAFVYAQSVNNFDSYYGFNPLYGTSLDFNSNTVLIGTPNFLPGSANGQVMVYTNNSGISDWTVYRQQAPIVDINKIQNTQIYSASTNNTLVNLDYIDPLQGKIFGAVRENLDYVSGVDPATYNNVTSLGRIWGASQVGKLWFNTTNVRFVDYHQNDNEYNAKYWGTVFPGSDVAIYSWVASINIPSEYTGTGTPYSTTQYCVSTILNASGLITPIYYFWVRNTNVVNTLRGKNLADSVLETYISNPKNSGISYMAPLLPNTFALYNVSEYLNANDSVFHIGYGIGNNDEDSHQEFALIRENYSGDFLPGLPNYNSTQSPTGLYLKMINSLAGCDQSGGIIPDPYLPLAVQSGIFVRPRQSFFHNRFQALQNYLTYANDILASYPIAETRRDIQLLYSTGTYYNTTNYWSFVNWWATGYSNDTKASKQVAIYADLATLNSTTAINTLVTVEKNGDGKFEVYRYDGNGVWTRIGLQNGTIQFNLALWDYADSSLGFGNNFFDTNLFDQYPSEETRYIVRALNEQIYINELEQYQNSSLILLFNYIQSETSGSLNFMPWLTKTSLVDVSHTVRNLVPIDVYRSDNQTFLEGYIDEVKPFHVVIKEFSFRYTGEDDYDGDISDFDLPAEYNNNYQEFISPQLVFGSSNNEYQYTLSDPIWQTGNYSQWFGNFGLSLTESLGYSISTLESYLTSNTSTIVVDNASGFPTNGVITIDAEQISYSTVDRSMNTLSGLNRGFNGTTVTNHVVGTAIYMDLPSVILLDGGRGYSEPPKISAYIDTSLYPAPKIPAILEAVMNLDSVLSINVINPGLGYPILPVIKIDPSLTVYFANTDINSTLYTIRIYAPNLLTGDLVQYFSDASGIDVGGLANEQWYYINVLQTTPTAIIALYSNYGDALKDQNRIQVYDNGSATAFQLNFGARASAITTSYPVRENTINIKFDRTSYNTQVTDWKTSAYYGAFFAGSYSGEVTLASSSVLLDSTLPPIESILASAGGIAFEIANVSNDRVLTWSSFIRYISATVSATNSITLIPLDGNNNPTSPGPNASGTTIGFYVGMPVYFTGNVIGGIIDSQTYYVHSILSETSFTISSTVGGGGSIVSLTDATVNSQGLHCYVGNVVDTAILTVQYPGILQVTATQAATNNLTVPLSPIGTGGTLGFYVDIPVFFTGNVFGGIVENQVYYVTTIIDNQTFTMSETENAVSTTVNSCSSATNYINVVSTVGLAINDPIIFNNMQIAGSSSLLFGNIISGTTYYISQIIDTTHITISSVLNGGIFNPGTVAAASNTTAILTDQINTVTLSTASGSMTMNVSLPVSPGQVDGQQFTLYQTSSQYTGINTGTIGNLIERNISATIATTNQIALSYLGTGTSLFYYNMPLQINTAIGGLSTATTYYIIEYSGMANPSVPGTYFTNIQTTITNTSSSTNYMTCSSTASLYAGMPIIFSGQNLGGVVIGQQYFVKTIINSTQFTISTYVGGTVLTLTTSNGVMVGTGDAYFKVSLTEGGSAVSLTSSTAGSSLTQFITGVPTFDISYIVGGYSAIITGSGIGFAIGNTITISGALVGGTTPTNDVTLSVNLIGPDGEITGVSASGTAPGVSSHYYLKVLSPNTFGVYSNQLLTVPVSGLTLPYVGYTQTTVTQTQNSGNYIVVSNASGFLLSDPVVFTGATAGGLVRGTTYYIKSISGSNITLSLTPNGSTVTITTNLTTAFTMAKAGSFAVLPEPFYFNQSIVRFNNKLYVCIISNNDDTFVFGKWQLLDQSDRRLNAMDRTFGYYLPTVNMPGNDLTQLYDGLTYPNAIYAGNRFAPDQQYILDVEIQNQSFYPRGVNLTSVLFNGTSYLASANLPTDSSIVTSTDGITWNISKLTNAIVGLTDSIYANGFYIITSSNPVTPLFRSIDGITWSTTGYLTNTTNPLPITVAELALQSVSYGNGYFVAVGDNIVNSIDSYTWTEVTSFDPTLTTELYSVGYFTLSAFTGFVAVGKGLRRDYSTGLTELFPTNVILYSQNGTNWNQIPALTYSGFYSVASNGTTIIAAGDSGVMYYSTNGANWLGLNQVQIISVNPSTNQLNVTNTTGFSVNDTVQFSTSFGGLTTGTTYYIVNIVSTTQLQVSATLSGTPVTLTGTGPSTPQTMMYAYSTTNPTPAAIRDLLYANSIWIAVGDNGTIKTSTNGINWTTQTSGTTYNLSNVTWNNTTSTFVVVGANNTVLKSSNNGVTWISNTVFTIAEPIYTITGDAFLSGYGPEEMIPGTTNDNLAMTVVTRPGSSWDVTEYSNTGFNVVSIELTPTSGTQTVYSFANAVQYPAQLSVQVLDATTKLGTTLATSKYSVNWISKTITLSTPISYFPTTQNLRIDVYEVGNGLQLVKSNTDSDPIRNNSTTGFKEIYLNCNYTGTPTQGSGVIRPGTYPIEVYASQTNSLDNSIVCSNISFFSVNSSIVFYGAVFGNIVENTVYYVKTVSAATNSITISATINGITGIAGPTFVLTDATGNMAVDIQEGTGTPWSTPIVYHNGTQLVYGKTSTVLRTKSSNNSITTNSTSGLSIGSTIVFSSLIFGSVITPFTTYYINNILDGYEFTISTTLGGSTLALTDATGTATYITNDYAFGIQPNGIQAKLVLANTTYVNSTDYLVYSVFGETDPVQFGFALPQKQEFTGNGSSASFTLNNLVTGTNANNAIVEVAGLRQTTSQYFINTSTNTILFYSPPANGANIAITTFNDTNQQYMNTQFGITGTPGSAYINLTITATTNIAGLYDENSPGTQSYDQNSPSVVSFDENYSYLTTSGSTSVLTVNNSLTFTGTTFGGIIAGVTYYITSIINSTTFTISTTVGGPNLTLTNATGSMTATANGTTVAGISSISNLITAPLTIAFATATTASTNLITIGSTSNLVVGQTIIFQGTSFGGIDTTSGTVYFVNSVYSATQFTICDQYGSVISLTTSTGSMNVTCGGTPAVRVTTAVNHAFLQNQLVVIDGTSGSIQLNGNTYYARIINNTTFDLYTQPYNTSISATNYPVTTISSYTGGGFTWRQGTFYLSTTTASATVSSSNSITVGSTSNLILNTPVYFTQVGNLPGSTILGGLVQSQEYYINSIINGYNFTVSASRGGSTVTLSSSTGIMNVTQWEQVNIDRLYVTVNGYRVPSSKLKLSAYNEVSILTQIVPGNEVIISSMIPYATPNQEIYLNLIDKVNVPALYRANTQTKTWLTQPIYDLSTSIYVNDVTRLTNYATQTSTVPAVVNGYYYITLLADKTIISGISVTNTTTNTVISSSNYSIVIIDTAPTLKIAAGSYISVGNTLSLSILEGNTILIDGEQIKFSTVDFANNILSGLQRGANGTALHPVIAQYTEVFGIILTNKMSETNYDLEWNSYVFDPVNGDPLQISQTNAAQFLKIDVA